MGHAHSARDGVPRPRRRRPADGEGLFKDRLRRMVHAAREHRRALVLTHDNPDPDAVASACGLAWLLERTAGIEAQAGYGGVIGRAENKALIKILHLPIQPLSRLPTREFDLICLVDTQPEVGNYSLKDAPFPNLVIDHHPARPQSARSMFHDVGGPAGATSTLVTQYLRAAKLAPPPPLATALFYGIKTDTRDLGREVEGGDIDCYNWLFPLVDKTALSRIEHPQVPKSYFAAYHRAYERARLHGDGQACVVDLGQVYVPEIVPEVAERMVSLEGLRWSLAAGAFQGELYLSLRINDRRMNAGRWVREICGPMGGSAGGHGAMAGARIPLKGRPEAEVAQEVFAAFLRAGKLPEGPGEPLVPMV
jgi:nanoRNase/pAp phosphatase (c-di-AMP/oligoRNAs hydrolase)